MSAASVATIIGICIKTHSMVLDPARQAFTLLPAVAEASASPAAEGGASWWMETFRPTLLQALANMTLVLRNVAVHCQAGGVTASLSCGLLHATSIADAELSGRPVSILAGCWPLSLQTADCCLQSPTPCQIS